MPSMPLQTRTIHFRKTKNIDITNFITDVACSHLVEGNHRDLDVNDLTTLYNSTLQNILNQHAPLMQKTVRIHPNSEWFNDHLRQLKLSKRRLETIWKDNQNDITFENFKIARNFYTSECDNAKRIYFSKLFNDCNRDKRKIYSLIDDLTKIDSNRMYPEENSEQIVADNFGSFFQNKINNITANINTIVQHESLRNPVSYALGHSDVCMDRFNVFADEEIKTLIMKSPNKSSYLDPLPTKLLKQCIDILIPVITEIVNKSLMSGCFPDILKNAIVTPIMKNYKSGTIYTNYRPISNLPFLSKII